MLASVAQGIEQRFPKPLVGRSNRLGSTSKIRVLGFGSRLFFVYLKIYVLHLTKECSREAFLAERFFASRVCSCYCVESRTDQVLVSI